MKDGCLAHLVYDAGAIDVRKQSIREPRPAQANVLPLVAYVGRERERARAQHDVDPAAARALGVVVGEGDGRERAGHGGDEGAVVVDEGLLTDREPERERARVRV